MVGFAALPSVLLLAMPVDDNASVAPVDFGRQVFPIFKAACLSCHSEKQTLGGLRLDTPSGIRKGGVSGALYEPGHGAKSLLVARIQGHGGKPQMPMGFAPLKPELVQQIQLWIDQGANIPENFSDAPHWAYLAPKLAPIPKEFASWSDQPIDRFVAARWSKEKLRPSPDADRFTLLRRVTLDLTGLPPTPTEVREFVADRSPQAFEKVVDRLLASPHFGEKQARIWLDLSRYADSDGYEKDSNRVAWKYRDWLIDSLNQNLPYDLFTIQQIAGDLLPGNAIPHLIATGFHRNTMANREGGVDQEEALYNVILDRVNTTAQVWLGQTMSCARCHDHKYDPISQRDFFRMYAFFANTEYRVEGDASVSEAKLEEPVLPVPTESQARVLEQLTSKLKKVERELAASKEKSNQDFERWRSEALAIQWSQPLVQVQSASGRAYVRQSDGSFQIDGVAPDQEKLELHVQLERGTYTGLRLEALPSEKFPQGGPGLSNGGNFFLSRISLTAQGKPIRWSAANANYVQQGFSLQGLADQEADTGWSIFPQANQRHELILEFSEPLIVSDKTNLLAVLDMASTTWPQHVMGRFRVSVTSADSPSRFALSDQDKASLLSTAEADRIQAIKRFHELQPELIAITKRRAATVSEIDNFRQRMPTAMIVRERRTTARLSAPVRYRGEFLSPREGVYADVPTILPPMRKGLRKDRLGFAKWLVDRRNPLTARVQVNRMWEQLFGRGLVETSENFGTMGAKPSHPELLDYLAIRFMNSNWNMKALWKEMVMSRTYRQSARTTAELTRRDPDNILLARGPRFRLEAESIRDVALAASGLLTRRIGGPSVYPSQPEGTWNVPYSAERWEYSQGTDRYRRSLYTFWKRTAAFPMFTALDATSREECTIRRIRTNNPLQALALLNDAGLMDAAKALARRMHVQGKDDPIGYGFLLCTGRWPRLDERSRLALLHEQLKADWTTTSQVKLADNAEEAAWIMVANTLLNLDETVTKG
jgi:hypothetical protein